MKGTRLINTVQMRVKYMSRFIFRLAVLIMILAMHFDNSKAFGIMNGFNFFRQFTLLHVNWIIWIASMTIQVVPTRNLVSIGSQKQFAVHYIYAGLSRLPEALKRHTRKSNIGAIRVLLLWPALTVVIGILKKTLLSTTDCSSL